MGEVDYGDLEGTDVSFCIIIAYSIPLSQPVDAYWAYWKGDLFTINL
jgi:hypothetical protein